MARSLTQAEKAQRLRELHRAGQPLVLVNAWDVASARAVADLGFEAVATSSWAVAASLGFPDGEQLGRTAMLQSIKQIADAVDLPVTADLEAGYGPGVEDAELTARGAIQAGAAGLNFEDGTHDPDRPLFDIELQAERIRAIKRAGEALGVPLVINARIDAYIRSIGDGAEMERETIRRARAYVEAGADCIFPIMLKDEAAIARLVAEIRVPVNILCTPDGPPPSALAKLGVQRISFGPRPFRAAMDALREFARSAQST